jgi:hypothetical protein
MSPASRFLVGASSVGVIGFGICTGLVNVLYGATDETTTLPGCIGVTSSAMFVLTGINGLVDSMCCPKNIKYIPKRLMISTGIQLMAFGVEYIRSPKRK